MLQERNQHLPTKDWKVVKVEEHEGDVNQVVLVLNKEELEAPGGPEDGYSTDSSLSRVMRALGPAIEDVDLCDTEKADVTVVEVEAVDITKTSTNKPSPQ